MDFKGQRANLHTADRRLARGMDTPAMLTVLAALFEMVSMLFLPWFSCPALQYTVYESQAGLFRPGQMKAGLVDCYACTEASLQPVSAWLHVLQAGAVAGCILLALFILLVFRIRVRASLLGRIAFLWNGLVAAGSVGLVFLTNHLLHRAGNLPDSFYNMTLGSDLMTTPYACALILFALIFGLMIRRFLDTGREFAPAQYINPTVRESRGPGKRTFFCLVLMVTAMPGLIAFGVLFLNDRSVYFISLTMIVLSMAPFFAIFEQRRPQAREIVLIAVLAALAAASRLAFIWAPFFKPMAAIVIIAAVALGSEAGFMTGAMAAFVSNFIFGQGPWTPWQMYAYGMVAFVAGLIFRKMRERADASIWPLCIYGFLSVLLIYGLLLDTSYVFQGMSELSKEAFLAAYASGLPVNLIHATATFLFLRILGKPLLKKLNRIKVKYGIMEA